MIGEQRVPRWRHVREAVPCVGRVIDPTIDCKQFEKQEQNSGIKGSHRQRAN